MGNNLKHVIILMQENRSSDEYFGTFPGREDLATPRAFTPTSTLTTFCRSG